MDTTSTALEIIRNPQHHTEAEYLAAAQLIDEGTEIDLPPVTDLSSALQS